MIPQADQERPIIAVQNVAPMVFEAWVIPGGRRFARSSALSAYAVAAADHREQREHEQRRRVRIGLHE